MATIKAIEKRSVHQIQSGQVIVDLLSVVKELVENSLDAGATSIEVRFKNHGLDSIEVQDTGKGIAPEDFETIALKHYTSKLSSYEDLTSLDTFGFRGEALSSLCALSNFHIVTARAEDGSVGKKLEFESSGKLKGTSVVASQKGTTVIVDNIFANLPVRRKELEKNIKREYGKALSHLYAYACISVNVRFSVSNHMPKAKKVSVFSTKANPTTRENIVNVFGAKTLLSLVRLDLHLEMEPSKGPLTQSARNWATQTSDRSMKVHVQGHISKPVFGEGRQAPDRQMFFVNSRPCMLPQISKAFNEVYKSFNVSQNPFVFANLVMDTNAYDVNVSPDKRSILLHDQAALLDSLKQALTELFEQSDYTVPQSTLPNRKLPSYKPLTMTERSISTDDLSDAKDDSDEESGEDDDAQGSDGDDSVLRNTFEHGTQPSLIHNWVGRDTEPRRETTAPARSRNNSSTARQNSLKAMKMDEGQTVEAEPLRKSRNDFVRPCVDDDQPHSAAHPISDLETELESNKAFHPASAVQGVIDLRPLSSPHDDLFSQRPKNLRRRVDDFKALVDGKHADTDEANTSDSEPNDVSRESAEKSKSPEPAIAATAPSSQKATPGPVPNAFDRMRPKRTPLQTAEITIGDTTTTTVIGSGPPYKKRRVHQPVNSQSIAQSGSPLVTHGLRNFAAPGSQLEVNSSDVPAVGGEQLESSDVEGEETASEDGDGVSEEEEDDGSSAEPRTAAIDPQQSDDVLMSEPLDSLLPMPMDDDEYDDDYVDEAEKKMREDEKIARLIQEAELAASKPTEENLRRASQVLKNTGNRKETTLHLAQHLDISAEQIERQISQFDPQSHPGTKAPQSNQKANGLIKGEIGDSNAESRLSLTVSKSDFEHMRIIGQFNLGFILAVRPSASEEDEDELFIIDQHAADEKYNYERLQRTVTLQSQRLVRPKPLDLTAVEEEIVLNNTEALKANGFEIEITSPDDSEPSNSDPSNAHRTFHLLTLPMSKEKTFLLSDLEELLHLLSENPTGNTAHYIPRPKKVQSMLAMRACRSSIMVGRTLTAKQMGKVVGHMGEMEKPWNCPHGRPTMRHLAGLGAWRGWREGDDEDGDGWGGGRTDWRGFIEGRRG